MELSFEISEDELPVFMAETDEQLQLLDEGLLQLEREGESTELLQELFRAAHTLKGAAGMIAHKRMVSLTHVMETAFDGLRKETYKATPELIELCFEAIDALRKLRVEVIQRQSSDVAVEPLTDRFSELYLSLTPGEHERSKTIPAVQQPSTHLVVQDIPIPQQPISEEDNLLWIQADISSYSVASAARAYQLLLILEQMGDITELNPPQSVLDTAKPVRQLTAQILTDKTAQEIRKALEAISEIDRLVVTKPNPVTAISERTTAAHIAQSQAPNPKFVADKTVRTSVERLDNLMNLVGELITDRNRINQIRSTFEARFRGDEDVETLGQTISHISRITDQLQSEVMGIRMVPIANVFNKFPRMVRDLANRLGKKIDFVVKGEETELDRSLIELINDPLIHLLRNAVDHGVEIPENRLAAGKSERARVLLSAQHEQGHIIITVEDNGRGINPVVLKEKAVKKGMISENEASVMSEDEAINLIFMSGFSTASVVSDVSGRGVGLDIVRSNIQRLNGSVTVETWVGEGSRFQIILPLTLAIIQTLLVRVSSSRLAIPLVAVMSTLRIKDEEIQTVSGKPVILLRDKVLPILHLTDLFHFSSDIPRNNYRYIVVVSYGKHQIGLLVDRLLGEEEVVVKSLGSLVGEINGISSAAILGDGRVILIVDVQDLFKLAGIIQF